jgi:hypothetical protein
LKKEFASSTKMDFKKLRSESTLRVILVEISMENFMDSDVLVCLIQIMYVGMHRPALRPAVLC